MTSQDAGTQGIGAVQPGHAAVAISPGAPEKDVEDTTGFDFDTHRREAEEAFSAVRGVYDDFAGALRSVVRAIADDVEIQVHSIESRAKNVESFGRKAAQPAESDPSEPKYPDPLNDIQDLAGVRVITFFLADIDRLDSCIAEEFEVIEVENKSDLLEEAEKFGYQSVHYIVRMKTSRCELPEYRRFDGLVAEIQLRTILQHAWAEIEHDIQYKSVSTLPAEIRRRFMSLAGMLEIADREFQGIQIEDARIRDKARQAVDEGRLELVEITPDALKRYLDKRLGPDGRLADYSYASQARRLKRAGFESIEQLDRVLEGVNDNRVTYALYNWRQGQLTRLDDDLIAAMGENFLRRFEGIYNKEWMQQQLTRLQAVPAVTILDRDIPPLNEKAE